MRTDEKSGSRLNSEEVPSTSQEDTKPKCVGVLGEDCANEPIYTCKRCGRPVCIHHAEEFVADSPEEHWHQQDGYYCPACIGYVTNVYREQHKIRWHTAPCDLACRRDPKEEEMLNRICDIANIGPESDDYWERQAEFRQDAKEEGFVEQVCDTTTWCCRVLRHINDCLPGVGDCGR